MDNEYTQRMKKDPRIIKARELNKAYKEGWKEISKDLDVNDPREKELLDNYHREYPDRLRDHDEATRLAIEFVKEN